MNTMNVNAESTSNDLTASLERRLASVHDYSLVQLRECKGPMSMHADLVDEIRQDMITIESQLEEIALLAEDQETEQARRRILAQLEAFNYRIGPLRQQIREATLCSKRRIESQNASTQRDELFKTANKASASIKTKQGATSKDDELMSATANVTDGLRRTRQLMEQELEKSSLSAQMLERSSQTLTLTTDQYTSFNGLLQSSKQLITALEKADSLDRILIITALVFFALVCLLIIKRRIIDRGIRAATLVGKVAGSAGGVGKKGIKVLAPSSVATALSSTLSAEAATVVATASSIASAVLSSAVPKVTETRASAFSIVKSDLPEVMASQSSSVSSILTSQTSSIASQVTSAVSAPRTISAVVNVETGTHAEAYPSDEVIEDGPAQGEADAEEPVEPAVPAYLSEDAGIALEEPPEAVDEPVYHDEL